MTAKTATKLRVASNNPAPAEAPAAVVEPSQPMIDEADKYRMEEGATLERVNVELGIIATDRVALEENHAREMANRQTLHDARITQMDARAARLHRIKAGAEAALKASEA